MTYNVCFDGGGFSSRETLMVTSADAPVVTTLADPVAVFIDLQARFCSADFDYVDRAGEAAIDDVIGAVNGFLERYRASGRTPVFVRTHHDELSNSPVWEQKYEGGPVPCRPGSEGAAFAEALEVRSSDVVVTKHRYNAFYGTPLDSYLSAHDISEVLVGGVATHVCVESAMRSAFDRDYDATVLADCTASAEPSAKAASLERIDGTFGSVAESGSIDLGSAVRT